MRTAPRSLQDRNARNRVYGTLAIPEAHRSDVRRPSTTANRMRTTTKNDRDWSGVTAFTCGIGCGPARVDWAPRTAFALFRAPGAGATRLRCTRIPRGLVNVRAA